MFENWWEPWCIDVPQAMGHSHVGTLNGSCGVGAGKNRKWEIWVKQHNVGTLVGVKPWMQGGLVPLPG